MKILLTLLLCLWVTPAHADEPPCTVPSFYDGFSGQFFNSPVTGFIYGLDEQQIYVTFTNLSITGFNNVPQSTATAFLYTSDPAAFYASQIVPIYPQFYNCGAAPTTPLSILLENGGSILLEDGTLFLLEASP